MKNETKVNSVSFLDYRFVLAVLAILFISVFASGLSLSDSFATDVPTSVNIKPSLTLTIPEDSISLVLDPASNTFASSAVHITVGTNNEKGYKLILSTPDNNTNLVSTVDSSKTIETLPTKTGGYTETEFVVNKWGYKLNAGNYIPYAPNATIMENSTKTNNDTTTLTFASKIDYEKPSGTYATTLSFKTIPTVTSYYMQDLVNTPEDPNFTTRICNESSPTIVIDSRDEQAYTIQRLKDGKCWMLDNLRLGSTTTTIKLTPSDTNIINNYELPVSASGYFGTESGTPTPLIDASLKNQVVTNYGLGSGKAGVYYNYCAATAGTYCYASGAGIGNAEYSVCPANWRMPSGNTGGDGDTLIGKYSQADDFKQAFSVSLSGEGTLQGIEHQNDRFFMWTSTNQNAYHMYDVHDGVTIPPAAIWYANRWFGISIRCLLDEP